MAKGRKTGGRKKGTPNKMTTTFREAALEVFQELGGVPAFVTWARTHKSDFYVRVMTRLIPTEIATSTDAPLPLQIVLTSAQTPPDAK